MVVCGLSIWARAATIWHYVLYLFLFIIAGGFTVVVVGKQEDTQLPNEFRQMKTNLDELREPKNLKPELIWGHV